MDVNLNAIQKGDHCNLKVAGDLTIYSAGELKTQLLKHLNGAQVLQIDLAAVAELDCAGLQLLYLLKREANAQQKTLSLVSHSAATLEALELLNMAAYFGDPIVLAS